jgi:hypothetical protein
MKVEAVYVNTGDIEVPAVDPGHPGGAQWKVVLPVPVPEGAAGVLGWKNGAFTIDRSTPPWAIEAALYVGGEKYDHFKAREVSQQPPHFLPAGAVIELPAPVAVLPEGFTAVDIVVKFFNEIVGEPARDENGDPILPKVRVNAWVWFGR